MAIAGTSMSSPHAAGVSLLVKAAHPTWTPEEIKSALMTSSVQTVVKEDGVTPAGAVRHGAGSIRADRAVNPTLVFNETYADFVAAGSDPLHRIDLNLASIDATTMPGLITTQRTAINVSGRRRTSTSRPSAPAGVNIIVGNSNRPTDPQHRQVDVRRVDTFSIRISAPNVANGQYFGRIRLDAAPRAATRSPSRWRSSRQQGAVDARRNTCSPATIASRRPALSHCTVTVSNLGVDRRATRASRSSTSRRARR